MSKVCKSCERELDLSKFQTLSRKDGRQWLSSYCKSCQNQKTRQYQFKSKYGVTIADRDLMIEQQGNKCAICSTEFKNGKDSHLDHCHETGKVRAILCGRCNPGLGYFDDDVEKLKLAIDYLNKHKRDDNE